ncbi:hypothetical protein XSR1_310019 [Xenorhabdus szentirmaii DSM 16338]|uniref:Uncharacterized protein n=1 Tax=Xenorhabdus szentirmaii DSM 16338 TaxID=1427518 RepID=W1J206_9GAMM|nr:hypothetical protein XSR1_310019 [Xenorhabdus szentirmaii DSM 16338]
MLLVKYNYSYFNFWIFFISEYSALLCYFMSDAYCFLSPTKINDIKL